MSNHNYEKSLGATICTVCSIVLALAALLLFIFSKGDVKLIAIGAVCVILTVVLLILASNLQANKQFKLWLRDVKRSNIHLVQLIQESASSARKIYNMHPGKPMLNYIRKYNPAAADEIQGSKKKQKKKDTKEQ